MMASNKLRKKIIVFTRFPELHKVKTRLAASIGPKAALEIHEKLAQHAIGEAKRAAASSGAALQIRITGGSPDQWALWIDGCVWKDQGQGDLGERMHRAFLEAFETGDEFVVVMGTDCPALDSEMIQGSLSLLSGSDVVFGPAMDGGYYLIGLKEPKPNLFQGIGWGGPEVFNDSIKRSAGMRIGRLPPLRDVDRLEDLEAGIAELKVRGVSA